MASEPWEYEIDDRIKSVETNLRTVENLLDYCKQQLEAIKQSTQTTDN